MPFADEAIRVASDTDYGLVAAIQTGSLEHGLDLTFINAAGSVGS
jgi:acyl-CoA reductase-like NAD-dependent aldehyde dehydrogenase